MTNNVTFTLDNVVKHELQADCESEDAKYNIKRFCGADNNVADVSFNTKTHETVLSHLHYTSDIFPKMTSATGNPVVVTGDLCSGDYIIKINIDGSIVYEPTLQSILDPFWELPKTEGVSLGCTNGVSYKTMSEKNQETLAITCHDYYQA